MKETESLMIAIPDSAHFYHLYAEGRHCRKEYDKASRETRLFYGKDEPIFLYYTYPAHRRAYLIRNTAESPRALINLPGLSKKVPALFTHTASLVDKTRKASAHIFKEYPAACGFSDLFFCRLSALISQKGKLNYAALNCLARTELFIAKE